MKKYIAAIAIDFGSTNSGCAGVYTFDANNELTYSMPELCHSDGSYAKDNTWFFVEQNFLQRIIESFETISDDEFVIESPYIFPHPNNPNIVWGRKSIAQQYSALISEQWEQFRWFKMALYNENNSSDSKLSTEQTIRLFFRILKIERLRNESRRLGRVVTADEILWGITIPSIWSESNKQLMVSIAHEVLTPQSRILSEPEGPMVSSLVHGSGRGRAEFEDGRVSLVIDCGGGTTDICLMRENTTEESPRVDMIAKSDGSAAGGNDIDNAFYTYFLRSISYGRISDEGIEYNNLDDRKLLEILLNGYLKEEPKEFLLFEDNWQRLKAQNDFEDECFPTCSFDIRSTYIKWLKNNGHKQVCEKVKELIEDGCEFAKKEIVTKVFNNTFDKICSKVSEIINNNREVHIDRIVLAGGMSSNNLLNSRLKRTVVSLLGDESSMRFAEMTGLMVGASIMAGSCYMLLHKDFVRRLANKTYYYDSIIDNINRCLKSRYAEYGISLKLGEIESILENEVQYRSIAILTPIAIKGQLVANYRTILNSSENQVHVNVEFFSTDGKIVVYSNTENPDLKSEAIIDIQCKPSTAYELEVDFNEAQISNALHYLFKEVESNEVIVDDYILNAMENNNESH